VGHHRNRKEIKKFLEFNENKNTTYRNLWNTAKVVLRGKFIAMNAYIKNTEKARHWWLMPIILATQEAEIRRIMV
jgi:hypothetical protein